MANTEGGWMGVRGGDHGGERGAVRHEGGLTAREQSEVGSKSTPSKSRTLQASLIWVVSGHPHLCSTLAILMTALALGWLPRGPSCQPCRRKHLSPLQHPMALGPLPALFCEARRRREGTPAVGVCKDCPPPACPQLRSKARARGYGWGMEGARE